MKSAARSAIMTTGALVLQDGMIGITEASAIRNPVTPRTRSDGSTTACFPVPIAQVPQVWKKVVQALRTNASRSRGDKRLSGDARRENSGAKARDSAISMQTSILAAS